MWARAESVICEKKLTKNIDNNYFLIKTKKLSPIIRSKLYKMAKRISAND